MTQEQKLDNLDTKVSELKIQVAKVETSLNHISEKLGSRDHENRIRSLEKSRNLLQGATGFLYVIFTAVLSYFAKFIKLN